MPKGTTIADAYVQIMPSAQGIKGKIKEQLSGEVSEAGKYAGNTIVDKIKSIILAAGIGTAITGVIRQALDAGGALQQSFGGLETIYGDVSNQAKQFAVEAAAAGMSANTWAENAVSFGAALRQAYGGDMTQAVNAANTAILDMNDNAAKMGTDIGAIQSAYQGFAKQNYTMLDNLKLGYGGTKTEMQRLLQDAEKLTGIHYDIDNLGDVYNAIHAIQEDLGLTGVAAYEASQTFTGSMSAMKAAAQNLLANLSLGEDITASMEVLTKSTNAFLFNNFLPMVSNVLGQLPNVLIGIVNGFVENSGQLMTAGANLITNLLTGIRTMIPQLLTVATEMIQNLTTGIATAIPTFLASALPMLTEWTGTLRESFGLLVDAGIDLILNLLDGIIASLPTLLAEIPLIVINIAGLINDNIPKIFAMGWEMIKKLALGIWEHKGEILENMGNIIKAVISVITAINWVNLGKQVITLIKNGITNLINAIPDTMNSIVEWAKKKFTSIDWTQVGKDVITTIKNGILALALAIPNAVKDIVTKVKNKFTSIDWGQVGRDIINGIKNGIKNMASSLANAAKNAASAALNGVKNFLGIHSPSTVFRDEIGKNMALGIGEGFNRYFPIDDMTGTLQDSMDDITADSLSSVGLDLASTPNSLPLGDINPNGNTNYGGFNINIYPDKNTNARQLADELMDEIQKRINQGRMVFGR